MRTHQMGHDFHLATHNGVLTAINDPLLASAELQKDAMSLVDQLLRIDINATQCSQLTDKAMILAAVDAAVGRVQFNLAIRSFLAEAGMKFCGMAGKEDLLQCQYMRLYYSAEIVAWSGRTPLHQAAVEGDLKLLDATEPSDIDVLDSKGITPLMLAAIYHQPEMVERLAGLGANVNHKQQYNMTPLMGACGYFTYVVGRELTDVQGNDPANPIKTVQALLKLGADVNQIENLEGFTALTFACWLGGWTPSQVDVVKLLLEHGAEVNHLDRLSNAVIWHAVGSGSLSVVELLIENGAELELERPCMMNYADDGHGDTLAQLAAAHGHKDVVEFLGKQGADLKRVDKDGRTVTQLLEHALAGGGISLWNRYLEGELLTTLDEENAKAHAKAANGNIAINHCHDHIRGKRATTRLMRGLAREPC